jgi:hypothetical protein
MQPKKVWTPTKLNPERVSVNDRFSRREWPRSSHDRAGTAEFLHIRDSQANSPLLALFKPYLG